jgi:hypothetical protein
MYLLKASTLVLLEQVSSMFVIKINICFHY